MMQARSSLLLVLLVAPSAIHSLQPFAIPRIATRLWKTSASNPRLQGSVFSLFGTPPNVVALAASTPSEGNPMMIPVCKYEQLSIPASTAGPPRQEIVIHDLTPAIRAKLAASGMRQGLVTVISRHTTTAVTINEKESRLERDMAATLLRLIPPDERSDPRVATDGVRYQHNDMDQRPEGTEEAERCRENGWKIDHPEVLEAWREQEPINAHSHIMAMLVGSSESIPVVDGAMVIGQWQSILLVDLDGPRDRTVGLQLMGYQ